jgi:uncharacterized membrane protein YraQ (UPF0718 family)
MKRTGSDLVFVGLALGTGVLCYVFGSLSAVGDALLQAASFLLLVIPLLIGGLLIGALIQKLIVKDKISSLLGSGTGLRGLVIASAAGVLTPGGPLMVFPIVYALWTAGAEVGVLVTYIAAWSLLGVVKIIAWELPLLGPEFTFVRVVVCLPLPILAGVLTRHLTRLRWLQVRPGGEE